MTVQAVAHPQARGWLFARDPRSKLWMAFMLVCALLFIPRLPLLGLIVLLEQALLLSGGVALRDLGRTWRGLVVILLFVMIGQSLFSSRSGQMVLALGPVTITDVGLEVALRYALRLSGAAFAALIPVTTTPMPLLVRGLEKIGLPYNWGLMIGLALRYLAAIGTLYTTISEAQQARGLAYDSGGLVRRVRMALPTVVALIIASLRLSDSLTLGLAGRGFGLNRPRTVWRDVHMTLLDWIVILLVTILCAVLLVVGI